MISQEDSLLSGVNIQCMLKIKPPFGGQREDLIINGSRLSLLDITNRIREEFEINDIFPPSSRLEQMFESNFEGFVRASIEGMNVTLFAFGATNSGKTYSLEGSNADAGLISLFVDSLFTNLDLKAKNANVGGKFGSTTLPYTSAVKMKYCEIVDEEINDLLSTGSYGGTAMGIEASPLEGPVVKGIRWENISNHGVFMQRLAMASKNKTTLANEFGLLSQKATAVLQLQLIQTHMADSQTQIYVSNITFVDFPGAEVLHQDSEVLRIKEGATQNLALLNLHNVISDLSSKRGEYSIYDRSLVTNLLKESFGGNCLSVGIFTVQYDDQIGSPVTLRLLRQCQKITNYPIVNENRSLGLIKTYRSAINQLSQALNMSSDKSLEAYQLKIAELEKKMIDENLSMIKLVEEKEKFSARMQDIKRKFDDLVQSKAEVQTELIRAEEDKLKISKALIDMQISNTKLEEIVKNSKFDANSVAVHAESNVIEQNLKEEKATKAISQLQDQLAMALEEKKEIEMELISVSKNHMNKKQEVDEERRKTQRLGVDLINLINENKALHSDSRHLTEKQGSVHDDYARSLRKIEELEKEKMRLKEALMKAEGEIEKLRNEKFKAELRQEQAKLDYESRRVDLEKEFVNSNQHKQSELRMYQDKERNQYNQREGEKNMMDAEKIDLLRNYKDATRKTEKLQAELKDIKEQAEELRLEKNRLANDLQEAREAYRNRISAIGAGKASFDPNSETLQTYNQQEKQLRAQLERETQKVYKMRNKLKALRTHAFNLKGALEDSIPKGKMVPEIVSMDMPEFLPEEGQRQFSSGELENLQNKNAMLEKQIEKLNIKLETMKESRQGADINSRILEEIQLLKANPRTISRPGTATLEIDSLRKERNELLEENRRLKRIIDEDSAGPSTGNTKHLKQKLYFLEKTLRQMEKEKAELFVKATMATEQLKSMEMHLAKTTQDYQRKINHLKTSQNQY